MSTSTYKVKINVDPDGKVSIAAPNKDVGDQVIEKIKELTGAVDMDKIYHGKITRIEEYGLFVELTPGATGLVHISEIAHHRVQNLRSMFRLGEIIDVKVIGFDKDGKIKCSKKAAEPPPHGRPSPH